MSSVTSNLSVLTPTTAAKSEVDAVIDKAKQELELAEDNVKVADEKLNVAMARLNASRSQSDKLEEKIALDVYQRAVEDSNFRRKARSMTLDTLHFALHQQKQQLQNEADDDFDRKVAGTPTMRGISARVSAIFGEHVHPWKKIEAAEEKKTKRVSALRKRVIEYYDGQPGELLEKGYSATCIVTKRSGDGSQVVVAHLLPHGSDRAYWMNGFDISDIDDMRNVMLLSKNIEHAFDRLRLSFFMTEDGSAFRMKIWDPAVRNVHIFEGSYDTIGDFEGKEFVFPDGKRPFTRVLSFQAREAYTKALKMGWIDPDEPPPNAFGSPLKDDVLDCHVSSTSESPGKLIRCASSTSSSFPFNSADSLASPE